MRTQIEGSQAVAAAVALARPEVIAAYPISPQTHIVEALSRIVGAGELAPCEYINVESEFSAMSVCIGASAAGARTYTATASQGLLFMVEAVFNASGLGLPIVMTVANRAIGAPINIWNDQSDSMSQRDSGWIQLYARDNQEAADLHIQAFKIAEEVSLPVMVCMDGFVLTHAFEDVDLPDPEAIDGFLPAFEPSQILDPDAPVSIGAMVGPEAFTEVRYLAHLRQLAALDVIPRVAAEYAEAVGRQNGGLVQPYRIEGAEVVVVALGSVRGTLELAIDALRAEGFAVGMLGITTYRPFPLSAVCDALTDAKRVVVLERAFAVGLGGIVSQDVLGALPRHSTAPIHTVVAGLGGRPILQESLERMIRCAFDGSLPDLEFLDLKVDVVAAEQERESLIRRVSRGTAGASAERFGDEGGPRLAGRDVRP